MLGLLVAATRKEIAPYLAYTEQLPAAKKKHLPEVLITGIGLTATAYHITRQLQQKKYPLVIQAGIAGCFDKKLLLGSVVAVTEDTVADQGVMESGQLKTVFDLQFVAEDEFPFTKTWLKNPHMDLLKKTNLKQVKGLSVNEITTSESKIDWYNKHFNAVTESMEGAALHYTCLMEGIPFLQIRSLSNYIGERNKEHWKMQAAVENLNQALIQMVQDL